MFSLPAAAKTPWHGVAARTIRGRRWGRWVPWGGGVGWFGKALGLASKDSAPEKSLKGAKMSVVVRSQKADGFAHRLGPARPADSMNVILGMAGEVVVNHVGNAFHIDAPGGDIGGHQDPDPA
jgi:hypothetical protein